MKTATFNHLTAFAIAGAVVPAREAESFLAARLQLEVGEEVLEEKEPGGPSLVELREPDLGRVNYAEKVRGGVEAIWRPVVEDSLEIPPSQLLERLNTVWSKAEQEISGEALDHAAQIFAERARKKAEIVEGEAARLAAERGIPAAVKWLEVRKVECDALRKLRGQELARDTHRKKRQADTLEEIKEEWARLLGEEEWDPKDVAKRFLMLAGGVLLAGVVLWLLSLPVNSLGGLIGMTLTVLLTLHTARPIFHRLRRSRRLTRVAGKLSTGYKSLSLFGLGEATKRQEAEYYALLRSHIARIQEACEGRIALVEAWREQLKSRRDAFQVALFQGPPTIRPLLREGALEEWYRLGRSQAPLTEWKRRFACLKREPGWIEMDREAREALSFLKEVRAEEELYRIYPAKEDRMAFLQTLHEAAIGRTPGEAFLSLDFAATGGRSPQVHLLVEVEDPEHSELAKEINAEWGGAGVGVTIVQTSDPAEITLYGLVYGYPLGAIKEWDSVEASFAKVKEKEGEAIYPVLFPDEGEEKG